MECQQIAPPFKMKTQPSLSFPLCKTKIDSTVADVGISRKIGSVGANEYVGPKDTAPKRYRKMYLLAPCVGYPAARGTEPTDAQLMKNEVAPLPRDN